MMFTIGKERLQSMYGVSKPNRRHPWLRVRRRALASPVVSCHGINIMLGKCRCPALVRSVVAYLRYWTAVTVHGL